MYEAMMIAATGLLNQQRRLDTIANNIANVNTVGYKNSRLDFKDALYTSGIVPGLPRTRAPEGNQQKGHGVMIAGIAKDYRTGSVQTTSRPLDVAIEGEGFFELEDVNGEICYTRCGSFYLDDAGYLVNGNGYFIHDTDGERIIAPYGTDTVGIDLRGVITFTIHGAGSREGGEGEEATERAEGEEGEVIYETKAALGIYTFRNVTGLASVGESNYGETAASGEKMTAENIRVRQGMLEMSNVSLAEEMTRMVRTQRAFQLASRALTTADQMEGIANNMRR